MARGARAVLGIAATLLAVGAPASEAQLTANGPEQARLEARAVRIFRSASVQHSLDGLTRLLRADTHAGEIISPDRLTHDAEEIAFGEVENALNGDTQHPFLYWYWTVEHRLGETRVPGGKFAMSNPDTVFRYAAVDPAGRYRISGQFPPVHRSYLSFHLTGGKPGEASSIKDLSVLLDDNLKIAPDGRFTVTLDARPDAEAGPNHIQLTSGANRIGVRDTLADSAVETPMPLAIVRDDPAPDPQRSDQEIAAAAAAALDRDGPVILGARDKVFLGHAPNTLPPPTAHPSGNWAITVEANYALTDDEALVFTLGRLGARYLGVQPADMLTGTLEPNRRLSTLNSSQALSNPDGSITFVLAPHDPGTRNWIDVAGNRKGLIMVRWQGLPTDLPDLAGAVRGVQVVELANLPRLVPATWRPVSAAERTQEIAAHSRAYERRFSGW